MRRLLVASALGVVSCGSLLGVDFDDARLYDADGGANGPLRPDADGAAVAPEGRSACAATPTCNGAPCPTSSGAVVAISAWEAGSFALMRDGTVRAWGLGTAPVPVKGAVDIVRIVGQYAIDRSGKVYYLRFDEAAPLEIAESGLVDVAFGSRHVCVLTAACGVKCLGNNKLGQLGNDSSLDSTRLVDVVGLGTGVREIATAFEETCALLADDAGTVQCWGAYWGTRDEHRAVPEDKVNGVVALGVSNSNGNSYGYKCGLRAAGTASCWGYGAPYIIEDQESHGPPRRFIALALGAAHRCLLTEGGAVVCQGKNDRGQLGDGSDAGATTTGASKEDTFVEVAGLGSGVVAIAAAGSHTCALSAEGRVKCWGADSFAGDKPSYFTPTEIDGW